MLRRRSGLGAALLGLAFVSTVVLGACADQKGALMLAISTDMKAPKDVNAISVTISTNGAIKHSFIGRVTPQGEVLLPATLAIVEPEDKNATIRIRVMAFQERKPRVLRDVRTTVSSGRTALLRIPLNFANDGSTKSPPLPTGVLPAPFPGTGGDSTSGDGASAGDFDFLTSFVPDCPDPENQTFIDGICADNFVDANALPDFDASLVGDSIDKDKCFDVGKCFANATADGPVTLDRQTCTLSLNGTKAERLNIALVTKDTGECVRPGECYVPVDHGGAGWKEDNGHVQLPQFVCRLLGGDSVRLATSIETCAAKEESTPICAEPPITNEPPADGCAGFGKAWCEKLSTCGYLEFVELGNMQACAKVLTDYCTLTHAAPGAVPVTAECNASFTALSCEQLNTFEDLFPLACYSAGTLPDASPCQYGVQCSSARCEGAIDSEGKCGVCTARAALGADCSGSDCALGLRCVSGKCVQPVIVRVGDDCTAPERRDCFKSDCVNGKCVPYLAEGASCASSTGPSCDATGGYHCSSFGSDTPTCKKITVTDQVGAMCGLNGVDCGQNLSCKSGADSSQPGMCVPDPMPGQPCDSTQGVDCASFGACVNGTCVAADPARCNSQ